ncbi:MAG: hypothetical protein N2445_09090, partial [Acidobacteria bacterium]|nr:hypothetical protein [Acidobacteriota bacterium]
SKTMQLFNFPLSKNLVENRFSKIVFYSPNGIKLSLDLKGNEIFVLDYQDALFAPRTYDFGSLYVDGYYDFSREERAKIKNFAISLFGATEKEFLQTALQRALKALGTFGFQIVYRKKAKYIDSIKRTTRYLEELISCKTLEYEKSREYLKEIQNKITSELCG